MAQQPLLACTARRPVAITMMVAAAIVFGLVGLSRLPVNLLPDISYPTVTIRTEYPGASPQDVEERVSERIQDAVSVTPGVRRVVSISRPGVSDVILQFQWGTEIVFAVSDLRERLDRVFLPRAVEPPLVLRYDPSLDPVLTLGLTGTPDLVELRRFAEEELERELSDVAGVAAVKVRGGDEEEIRIAVDERLLAAHRLDVTRIGQQLAAQNVNAASGAIEEGRTEFLVRALNEFTDLEQIAAMVLETRNGVPIRLGDVARVDRVPQEKQVISRIDGQPCVLIDVYREARANIVELCTRVRERAFGTAAQQAFVAAKRHEAEPPAGDPGARFRHTASVREMTDYAGFLAAQHGTELTLLLDQSAFIQTAVDDVLQSALVGGMFAILVIALFLRRLAATVILAVSIPISLVASFAPMFMADISLNIMSLGGLALGVGMLVDNSIVVLESISRAREEGMRRAAAAVAGVTRVAGAVVASTLTTVAVFFPIVFVEGVAGQLFRDQALTVVFSLLASLLVALFVIPMLAVFPEFEGRVERAITAPATRIGRGMQWLFAWVLRGVAWIARGAGRGLALLARPVTGAFAYGWGAVDGLYPRVLTVALRARALVLLVVAGLVAFAVWRVGALGSERLPEVHQGEFFVEAFLPRDATVERTDATLLPLERAIAALPDVASTFLAAGVDKDELNASDEGEHSARILVRLEPHPDRKAQEARVRAAIVRLLHEEPVIRSHRFSRPSLLATTAPVTVEILGRDLGDLRRASEEVEAALRRLPGLADVAATMQRGNTEVSIELDRERLAALQLDSQALTRILQTKVLGDVPTRFTERERKIDMRVQLDREQLASYGSLLQLNVNPAGYPPIPLATVAELRRIEGPSEIRRIGNLRGAEVSAALAGFDFGHTQQRVEAALAELRLPRGVEVRLGGEKEELEESQQSLLIALALAVFLVYIVMACQFESILQPLIIMVTVPLALVGVVPMLDLLGIPVSIVVFLGGIVLAGIVVNNGIILIDQINQLRRAGVAKLDAIRQGAHLRLRPVAMTALTTILGLLPLTGWLAALPLVGGNVEGLELRAPMAVTVVTGLVASTLLTLIVVPVLYSLADRGR